MKALAAAAFCAAICLALAAALMPAAPQTAPAQAQKTAAPPDSGTAQMLFPGLDCGSITSLSMVTPDQSFQFRFEGGSAVSVNGSHADSEVFLTLLDQIAALPVDSIGAFSPRTEPLLTLVVHAGGTQHTARFYADGASGEKTHIVAGPAHAPQYRQTGLWRVGTLMMTCQGTRIQDISGNETPAAIKKPD